MPSDPVAGLATFMDALDHEIGSPPPGPERDRRLLAALRKRLDAEKGNGGRVFLQSMIDTLEKPWCDGCWRYHAGPRCKPAGGAP